MNRAMQIGAVAQKTGLTVDAIRFYERERLLRAGARTSGGFRLFAERDVDTLLFIRGAQDLGFSLEEIRDLIALRGGTPEPCARVERLIERKLAAVLDRITRLRSLERELTAALRSCRRELAQSRSASEEGCPVLKQLSEPRRVRRAV